jgi:hypothetical protein
MLRRAPFWCAVGGVIVGVGLSLIGVDGERNTALLVTAGFIATGGPILALVLGLRRRLGLSSEAARTPMTVGVLSGVAALGLALLLEKAFASAVGAKEGEANEWLLAAAGPIEEGAKLLVPVALLIAGAAFLRSPRAGVLAVAVSGGVFGAIEGALYAADLGGVRNNQPSTTITEKFPGVSESTANELAELLTIVPRIWTELGHPIWTTGAAVIIWLAVWERRKNAMWVGIGAYLLAAALHSFNDAVLTRLPGALPVVASIAFITLTYAFWFRAQSRRVVPPSMVDGVPKPWIPPLPK